MANKKDKNESKSLFGPAVDPETEAKVDEMMSTEIPVETAGKTPSSAESDSAPLLPTDKLPDIAKEKEEVKPPEEPIVPEPVQDAAPDLPKPEHEAFEDPYTDKAVEDIMAKESSELLAEQDKKKAAQVAPKQKPGLGQKIKNFFSAWWHNPLYRKLTIGFVCLVLIALAVIPTTRYFILNTAGVRSSSSVTILDQKTSQPLKNVEVQVGLQSTKTDKEGKAKLSGIKLGEQKLLVKKPAFAEVSRSITIGWGSNPLGEVKLTPVGSQYTFNVKDFLSDKPVKGAEATSGESSAQANENGEIVLTVPTTKEGELEIAITADSYRTENLNVPVANKQSQELKLVPAKKHAFVSKRSGKYDVYKIDVDGKNEEKVLAGTGSEREDSMSLVIHPTKDIAAFVSTRGTNKNQDGYQLSSLTLIDLKTNESTKIAESERVQIVGWVGDRIVYVKIAQGESAASTNRHKLLSYDTKEDEEKELASTNYFNDVLIAGNNIYYSPALYKVNGQVGLFKINADGSERKTVYDKEVWNLFRVSYDKIAASVGQDWYDYEISSGSFVKASGPPALLKSRIYINSPDSKKSLWVDDRDGKGVLLAYDTTTKEDKIMQTTGGLKNPVDWLDNEHVVYRVSTSQETADYVLNTNGGSSKKIIDVTNVAGVDRWYYY